MSTALTCGGCNRSPYASLPQFNQTYTGAQVLLLPNATTGLTTLNVALPVGCCYPIVDSTTSKILITAGGYTADNVGNTGTAHSDTLYTVGAATVVGSITNTGSTFAFTITFPSALADNLAISLSYYDTCGKHRIITVAKNYSEDPCLPKTYVPTELNTYFQAYVCSVDFCGGDRPGIYVNGQLAAAVGDNLGLISVSSLWNVIGGVVVLGGNPSTCNCQDAFKVYAGFNPGLATTDVVEWRNGSELVPMNYCPPYCTFTWDYTGTDFSAPGITVSSWIVDGVDVFAGLAPIVAGSTASLTLALTSLATQLTALGYGTVTNVGGTSLVIQSQQTFGAIGGKDGVPAAYSYAVDRSC